jgi:hypothetical protein
MAVETNGIGRPIFVGVSIEAIPVRVLSRHLKSLKQASGGVWSILTSRIRPLSF